MDFKMLINGQMVESDKWIDVLNPATEEVFARVPHATEAQLDQAVAAAAAAQKEWAKTSVAERRAKIEELVGAIAANQDELARLITLEQGKPLQEAMGEVMGCQGYLGHTATLELKDQVIQDDEAFFIEKRHKPLGVVGGIIPWNFPLLMGCWKIGPALMAGNGIVIKPSEWMAWSAPRIVEIAKQAIAEEGHSPDLVGLVQGYGRTGQALIESGIDGLVFIGSVENGRRVLAAAAEAVPKLPRVLNVRPIMPGLNAKCREAKPQVICGDVRSLTRRFGQRVRRNGYRLWSFTINRPVTLDRALDAGATAIISDRCDWLAEQLRRRGLR